MFRNIYKNKKVLVTGHTGFKGSWLTLWLNELGAEVVGYSLKPDTEPSLYNIIDLKDKCTSIFGDIRDKEDLEKVFEDHKPEIVFHLAAQPIVRLSYLKPVETYETNVLGVLNTLEAARKSGSVKVFVNVTTDKCYENIEKDYAYQEDDKMGGYDMYSSSKACSEILTSSYRNSFLKDSSSFLLASARAGNVIGGGDWAIDRLVPDCARSISLDKKIEIRNPSATRPWQHVLEPVSGYLTLGAKLLQDGKIHAEGFNFGPNPDSVLQVGEVTEKMVKYWGKGEVVVNKTDNLHEANLLQLNINKSYKILGWQPKYNADLAIQKTVEWYKRFYSGENMINFTLSQIKEYGEM
jgi:CDP-glucose 4,6-dehydratase